MWVVSLLLRWRYTLATSVRQTVVAGILACCTVGLLQTYISMSLSMPIESESYRFAIITNITQYVTVAIITFTLGPVIATMNARLGLGIGCGTYYMYFALMRLSEALGWKGVLVILGAILLGIGHAIFWTIQMVSVASFSTHWDQCMLLCLFWSIGSIGGVISGGLGLITDYSGGNWGEADAQEMFHRGFVNVMFTAMGVICFVAWIFWLEPQQVERRDNTWCLAPDRFSLENLSESIWILTLSVLKIPEMILLLPCFMMSMWIQPYVYTYLGIECLWMNETAHFAYVTHHLAQGLAPWILTLIVRRKRQLKDRTLAGACYVAASYLLSYCLCVAVQYHFDRGEALPGQWSNPEHQIGSKFKDHWLPILAFTVAGAANANLQVFIIWYLVVISDNESRVMGLQFSYMKGMQCIGASLAWGILLARTGYRFQLWMGFATFALSLPSAYLACRYIRPVDKDSIVDSNYYRSASVHSLTGLFM